MKILYFDCSMGAAGDMLTAALLELMPDKEQALAEINALGIPGVETIAEKAEKCGISGIHVAVKIFGTEEDEHMHDHGHTHADGTYYHHSHKSMHGIEHIVKYHLNVSEKVQNDILEVYRLIAEAESQVHGVSVEEIHFHEVGNMDAVADVAAVCYLMDRIAPDQVIASPVNVGSGTVKCAHGILPVPAPATSIILKGIPSYGSEIKGELCTPTGAALLKYFVQEFGAQPVMKTERIGYGMGKKDFERANCIRTMLGEKEDKTDQIIELACNLDDITAEEIGFATEQLLDAGALDVYTINAGMKKNRPGVILACLCRPEQKEEMIRLIFRHTTTLGIREYACDRYILNRTEEVSNTSYGCVRKKISEGYGIRREKFEYEDISHIARQNNTSIREVKERIIIE